MGIFEKEIIKSLYNCCEEKVKAWQNSKSFNKLKKI